ncbi:hypothetical protein D9757_008288 [Collybiopsis confluens]|uniref:PEBP-like protein n=1 Tax=Collybiopsis confluens TaxID=2823264 RepID=A0A8H5H4B1_9AGAR|nr:hypothetical protein D9757_008288 [Collybiopsis confluens]
MFALPIILALAIPLVAAQSNDTAVQIEAIEAHFAQAALVPQLLVNFTPTALLTINFQGKHRCPSLKTVSVIPNGFLVQTDHSLRSLEVSPTPSIKITANSSVDLSGNFTLAMVDADVVGADESSITRHWLENGVSVSNDQVSNSSATAITSYAGPAPPEGSGPHRYVVILMQQPASFSPPTDLQPNAGVAKFDFNGYVKQSQLGPIIAANYFTVEIGTSTVSISATSAVQSSTLVSASGTGTSASSSASASSTGSAQNAAPVLEASITLFLLGVATIAGVLIM